MIDDRAEVARLVGPGIRDPAAVAVPVVADENAGRGNAVEAHGERERVAGRERARQRDPQTVVLVLPGERLLARGDRGDRHALAAGRRGCAAASPAAARLGARIGEAVGHLRRPRLRAELAEVEFDRLHAGGDELHIDALLDDQLVAGIRQRVVKGVVRDLDAGLARIRVRDQYARGERDHRGACD